MQKIRGVASLYSNALLMKKNSNPQLGMLAEDEANHQLYCPPTRPHLEPGHPSYRSYQGPPE
jgi:hypothetical protein